ncbi:hypothetical protein KAR91_10935 [Candidatus Pacearchaeota archaeon]|nr:hypothetical protein [Candidatus Pacearchaeota archaeon]
MKLFTGKTFENIYSITITPAVERQSSSHFAVGTIAYGPKSAMCLRGSVRNIVERAYKPEEYAHGKLTTVAAEHIRKDIIGLLKQSL